MQTASQRISDGRANTRTGGGYNSGGNNFPATEWTNFGGQARLVLFDGSGVTGTGARGSFLAAGGAARPAGGVLSGGFTWAGALVLGEADDLDGTPEIGRFTLRYDFASSNAVKGSLEGAFADVPGNGGTTTAATIDVDVSIDAASGRITHNSAGTFALVAGATFDGVLAGYVSGYHTAQGISGVFATNGASGTQYAGGFVGGIPLPISWVRDNILHRPGKQVGDRRTRGRILNRRELRKARGLNVASDTVRRNTFSPVLDVSRVFIFPDIFKQTRRRYQADNRAGRIVDVANAAWNVVSDACRCAGCNRHTSRTGKGSLSRGGALTRRALARCDRAHSQCRPIR